MTLFSVVVLGASVMILLFAYAIRFHDAAEMIAGFDPDRVADRKGLTNWVSNMLFVMAGINTVAATISVLLPEFSKSLPVIFIGNVVGNGLLTAAGARSFVRS